MRAKHAIVLPREGREAFARRARIPIRLRMLLRNLLRSGQALAAQKRLARDDNQTAQAPNADEHGDRAPDVPAVPRSQNFSEIYLHWISRDVAGMR